MSVTTPAQGQKISDFSAGNVDANSVFIQANNGNTTKVTSTQIGEYSNLNLLFNGAGGLNTTSKTIVGAINEVNEKDASDIAYDNTASGLTVTDVQAAIDEVADDISTVTGTITLETGFTARGTPIVEKRNGMVFLQFNINGTNAFNTRTTLGNISAGFRPYRTCAFTVCASKNINSFANITTTMLITLSGDIIVGDLVLPADSNIKEVNACVTYVARN